MKTLTLALLALLTVTPAWAQSNAEALDLALPHASAYANDAPGTWYGDRKVETSKDQREEAPIDPCAWYGDDDGGGVSGSITTGLGSSKGCGRST